jgi:exopolysaccharide biosynthesis WecB/TagA/CpsF family protein
MESYKKSTMPAERWQRMLKSMRVCRDEADNENLLVELLTPGGTQPKILSFINAHGANLIWENDNFSQAIHASDLLLRDGIGMKILMKLAKREPGRNMNGTDFIPLLIERWPPSRSIAVYGTEEPWLSRGAEWIRRHGCVHLTTDHGFHPDEAYVARAQADAPELIILAMGMPKQERVAALLKERLAGHGTLIVNGGAVIDFLAARFPRAPAWVRAIGIEWLFRLLREPRRLWKRYVVGNVKFIFRSFISMHRY